MRTINHGTFRYIRRDGGLEVFVRPGHARAREHSLLGQKNGARARLSRSVSRISAMVGTWSRDTPCLAANSNLRLHMKNQLFAFRFTTTCCIPYEASASPKEGRTCRYRSRPVESIAVPQATLSDLASLGCGSLISWLHCSQCAVSPCARPPSPPLRR